MKNENDILVSINLKMQCGNAKLGQDFGPVIGQYGINIKNFCDTFNQLTKGLYVGMPIRLKVIIYKDKTFKINLKSLDRNFIIDYLLIEDKFIKIQDIYQILLIEQDFVKYYVGKDIEITLGHVRSIYHTLSKRNIKVIFSID